MASRNIIFLHQIKSLSIVNLEICTTNVYCLYGCIWLAALMLVLIADGALGIVGAEGPIWGVGPRAGPMPGAPTPGGKLGGIPGRSPFPVPTAVTNAWVSAML